jgi:CIC family chloride channel protein
MFMVARIMRRPDDKGAADEQACWDLIDEGTYIDGTATLEAALPIFDATGARFIPVVTLSANAPPELLGALFHVDALKAYNRALAATAAEEHS